MQKNWKRYMRYGNPSCNAKTQRFGTVKQSVSLRFLQQI